MFYSLTSKKLIYSCFVPGVVTSLWSSKILTTLVTSLNLNVPSPIIFKGDSLLRRRVLWPHILFLNLYSGFKFYSTVLMDSILSIVKVLCILVAVLAKFFDLELLRVVKLEFLGVSGDCYLTLHLFWVCGSFILEERRIIIFLGD